MSRLTDIINNMQSKTQITDLISTYLISSQCNLTSQQNSFHLNWSMLNSSHFNSTYLISTHLIPTQLTSSQLYSTHLIASQLILSSLISTHFISPHLVSSQLNSFWEMLKHSQTLALPCGLLPVGCFWNTSTERHTSWNRSLFVTVGFVCPCDPLSCGVWTM